MKSNNIITIMFVICILILLQKRKPEQKIKPKPRPVVHNKLEHIKSTLDLTSEQLVYVKKTMYWAEKVKLDPLLAVALVKHESNFNPHAVSRANAVGLAQVIFKWHYKRCKLQHRDFLKNPDKNLQCGLSHLKRLLNTHGDLETALAYYNTGESAKKKTVANARRVYVPKVVNYYLSL